MFFLVTASVPGAKEDDYKVDEELNKLIVEESELQQRDEARQLARQGNMNTTINVCNRLPVIIHSDSAYSHSSNEGGNATFICTKFDRPGCT